MSTNVEVGAAPFRFTVADGRVVMISDAGEPMASYSPGDLRTIAARPAGGTETDLRVAATARAALAQLAGAST